MRSLRVLAWIVSTGLACPVALPASAQEAAPDEVAGSATRAAPGPDDPFERGVPRTAMRGYLVACREGDFEKAAEYLDLRQLPAETGQERGPELARRFKIILDQKLWVDWESLSADPAGRASDQLPANRDQVGTIDTSRGPVPVLLQRVPREDGVPIWKISSATVSAVPALWDEFGYGPLERWLPDWMLTGQLLEIAFWQWCALFALLLIVFVVSWVGASLLLLLTRPLVRRSSTDFDDRILSAILPPFRLALGVALFQVGSLPLGLAVPARRFVVGAEKALLIVALTWLVFRLIDVMARRMEEKLGAVGQTADAQFIPLGRKTLKALLGAVAFLAVIDSFGFDVTALIATLGVGGIAVALAAQKTLENLFGGATIILDRPVRPGDFCRFGDRVGTVEEVGLRSTRLRTLDRTVVTVPNAEFSTLQLENFAQRDRIWYHPTIGLRYETTPDQLRYVLSEIRRMFYSHPMVDPAPARIRFVGFGDFSLNLDVFAYVRTADYNEYLEVSEDLNLRIMDIVSEAGTGFAFPSSTTYLAKDDGPDPDRAREIEAQVQAWRDEGALHVPRFPQRAIDGLSGTIEWPPAGSSARGVDAPGAGKGRDE